MPLKLKKNRGGQSLESRQTMIAVIIGLLFVALNTYFIFKEIFVVPFIAVGILGLYLLIFKLKWFVYLMAFVTPFSVIMSDTKYNIGLSIPSELMMIAVSLLFLMRLLYDIRIDKKYFLHPMSIAVYIYLLWIFITSITSELPIVSFKFFASKIWFIVSCYFVVIYAFKDSAVNMKKYLTCYAVSLSIIVIITTVKHAMSGFGEHEAHWIMSPYYNDHTAYGAVLAFFLPILIAFLFEKKQSLTLKFLYATLLVIISIGLYLSFSRAAWLSVVGMIAVWVALKLRIKFSWILSGLCLIGILFFSFQNEILHFMNKNDQDASGNFTEQIQSITNISTDASNVERLNRWVSAFGMVEERPWFGWGPGTYQFEYAPFQKPHYKTIITTNFGDGGNAHSEYFGPLAETGIIGMFTVILLVIMSIYYGINAYIQHKDKSVRIIVLGAVLALITYFIHGVLNNFWDTDKLSLPIWGCFAVIICANIDVIKKSESTLELHDQSEK